MSRSLFLDDPSTRQNGVGPKNVFFKQCFFGRNKCLIHQKRMEAKRIDPPSSETLAKNGDHSTMCLPCELKSINHLPSIITHIDERAFNHSTKPTQKNVYQVKAFEPIFFLCWIVITPNSFFIWNGVNRSQPFKMIFLNYSKDFKLASQIMFRSCVSIMRRELYLLKMVQPFA